MCQNIETDAPKTHGLRWLHSPEVIADEENRIAFDQKLPYFSHHLWILGDLITYSIGL